MKTSFPCLAVVAALMSLLTDGHAADWPHWRGPEFNGATTEEKLPVKFSPTNNVRWVAELPGPSAATPVVWSNHVFVSSTDLKSKTLRAIALDRATGKLLWDNEISPGFNQDERSNLASPSPTTDGERAYFLYATGDLAGFDFSGKKIWSRNLQKDFGQFVYQWTYGASPTLFDGKLFIQVLQRDKAVHGRGEKTEPNESYLLALDPKTGKELWRHVRASDAVAESREAYSTPIPHKGQLLISGGDCLTAHDPRDGKELFRWGSYNLQNKTYMRLVPSPVVGDGIALVCAPQKYPLFAVKFGAGTNAPTLAWQSEGRELFSDTATPLFYRGRFYVLNGDRRTIYRIEPTSGKIDWTGDLGGMTKFESSPTAADGKIYFQNMRGDVFVVAAGEKFDLLSTNPMGGGDDGVRSSVAISGGCLFIRTAGRLFCVEAIN
jgi:outer membrane protein assembly factor BamB